MSNKIFYSFSLLSLFAIALNAQDTTSLPSNSTPSNATPSTQSIAQSYEKPNAYGATCYYTKLGKLSYCGNSIISIGTYYDNFSGPLSNANGLGGYLSVIARMYAKWFYLGSEAMLGYANYTLNNKSLINSVQTIKDVGYNLGVSLHFGVDLNYLSNVPVLLYLDLTGDQHDFTINNYGQGFDNISMYLGFGAFSEVMLTQRFGVNFQANLAYAFAQRYIGYGFNNLRTNFDGSYKLEGAIGVVWHDYEVLPPHRTHRIPSIYARIKGIYYSFNAMDLAYRGESQYYSGSTIHLPKTNNFSLMFEVGLGF